MTPADFERIYLMWQLLKQGAWSQYRKVKERFVREEYAKLKSGEGKV